MPNSYYENAVGVSSNKDYMNLDVAKGIIPRNNGQNRYNIDFNDLNVKEDLFNNKSFNQYRNFDFSNEIGNHQGIYNADLTESIYGKNYASFNGLDINNIGSSKSRFKPDEIKGAFIDKVAKILNQDIDYDLAINMINKGMLIIDQVTANGNGFNMEVIQIGSHLIDQGIAILNRDIDVITIMQNGINIYESNGYF